MNALSVLAGLRDPRVFEPALKALHDPEPGVRANAATALGNLNNAAAILALMKTLASDSSLLVKLAAIQALESLHATEAIPTIQQVGFENQQSADIQSAVIGALGQIRSASPAH